MATCPSCREQVHSKATRCPHCAGKINRFGLGKVTGAFLLICAIAYCSDRPSYKVSPSQIVKDSGTTDNFDNAPLPPPVVEKPKVELTKLFDRCDPGMKRFGGCGDAILPVWRKVESDTGEITKVDMASIRPSPSYGATAVTYTYVAGSYFNMSRLVRLYFTCKGQYADIGDLTALHDAPPQSVVGIVASIVCPVADAKRPAPYSGHSLEDAFIQSQGGSLAQSPPRAASENKVPLHPRPDALIEQASAANDECQGGPHDPGDAVCSRRDQLYDQIEKLGWCWAYADRPAADDSWHACFKADR